MFFMNNTLDTDTRYDLIKFTNFNVDNLDPTNSFMLLNLASLPVQGTYIIQNETARPDLLSYRLYKDTQYWWALLWYNSIMNINDLKTGMTINYFNLDNLEELYMTASLSQKAV